MEMFYIEDEQQNLNKLWGLLKNLSFNVVYYYYIFLYCVEPILSLKQAYMSCKAITYELYLRTDSSTEGQEDMWAGGQEDMSIGR